MVRAAFGYFLPIMTSFPLTGAQRTRLRGLGQTSTDNLLIGRDGAADSVIAQLNRELTHRELVKVRFTGGQDRKERAALHDALASSTQSECVGAVGHTALFFRRNPDPAQQKIALDQAR